MTYTTNESEPQIEPQIEPRKLRIFLADDHAFIRDGLRTLILRQADMEVVGEADSGESALQQVRGCSADIVVMDISMPGINGAQATQKLKELFPDIKVLCLSAHEEAPYVRAVFEAGASGYVVKRAAAKELVQAIRSIAAGGTYIDPVLAGILTEAFVRQGPTLQASTLGSDLSERESEVLRLIAVGYSGKEIAGQMEISEKTVESYKGRALEKLGIQSRVEIVRMPRLRDGCKICDL
jgi:DNA-binding NarL/FixJ family response regulator